MYVASKEKKKVYSVNFRHFFAVFLPVTITLTEKIISWKGSSDACFVEFASVDSCTELQLTEYSQQRKRSLLSTVPCS